MAKLFKKAVATIGKYTKNGVEKKRYMTVGALFQQDDGGFSLKLDAVPCTPEWSGWISFFDPDNKEEQSEHNQAKANGYQKQIDHQSPLGGDTIPF